MSKKEDIKQNEFDVASLSTEELQESFNSLMEENQSLIGENETFAKEVEKLNKTVARMKSSADNSDKFRDQLVAMKSDFDSYKRRQRNAEEEFIETGIMQAVEKILPILDTFAIAKGHLEGDELVAYEMVEGQFLKALRDLGVEQIEALNCEFDVNTMNALTTIDKGEEHNGKVVEVYKQGYKYKEKIIRFAEVIVGN